jgi:prepilin-type N-terminal cleavage/methylation domain-containing protein
MERRSYTLIEILIVVLIIGILVCLAQPSLQGAIIKARLSELLKWVSILEKEVDFVLLEQGWPANEHEGSALVMSAVSNEQRTSPSDIFRIIGWGYGSTGSTPLHHSFTIATNIDGATAVLCRIRIYATGEKRYYIVDAHDWGRYLRVILPTRAIESR